MVEPTQARPLSPTLTEVALSAWIVLHVALIAFVVVQLLRGRMTVPHGIYGWIVLLYVPVVGPLLVLTWQSRVARYRAQSQHPAT